MNPPKKSQDGKKSSSLSWKLAFSQTKQVLLAYVKTNILLALLIFLSLAGWSEVKSHNIYRDYLVPPKSQSREFDYPDSQVRILPAKKEGKPPSRLFIEKNAYFTADSFRKLSLEAPNPNLAISFEPAFRFPAYKSYYPGADSNYWEITVFWEIPLLFIGFAGVLLIIYQLLSIPFIVVRARNRIRLALQPIYELTAAAQHISSGNPDFWVPLSGTIDALNDITAVHFDKRIPISHEREELQGLAQAINDMLDRLDASYQAQLRFVSDASHELRTPIAIIQGYANLLSRWGKDDPKTLQESIDAIGSEAIGMQKLVEQLLFLARTDNQSLQIQKEAINLSELLTEVLRETEMINDTHEFIDSIQPDIHIVGDPRLIKQATRILVDNGIKYTPDKGRITIGLEDGQEEIHIYVSDTGIGIPADDLGHLFKRFWRADESRTRKTGGTGLGLSIATWIAEIHGGYISVVSRVDAGSKFTVFLPKTKSLENIVSLPPTPEESPLLSPESVLKETDYLEKTD